MPAMARHQDRRKLLMLALALQLVGFCGFIWLPLQLPVLWAMVCGLGLGGAFPLCLLLALDHSAQPAIAGKLVAFMQGIGFIIAGLAPWFSGVLRSISGNYLMDWAFHALCVVGADDHNPAFCTSTFSAAVGQRGMMRRLFRQIMEE